MRSIDSKPLWYRSFAQTVIQNSLREISGFIFCENSGDTCRVAHQLSEEAKPVAIYSSDLTRASKSVEL